MKRLLLILLLYTAYTSTEPLLNGISFFSPRSQSTNAARDIVGWHPFIHQPCEKENYYTLTATPEYTLSVRPDRMSQALFGTSILNISGSMVEDRQPLDLLADYFGLSPTFESIVQLDPFIQNRIMAFNGYIGFDKWVPGLYFTFSLPILQTKWDLQLCEEILETDDLELVPFPNGYMGLGQVQPQTPSFTAALAGGITYGAMQIPLMSGLVQGSQTLKGVSDIQLALGYDIVNNWCGYAGLNLRMSIPTGSRPCGRFLFEPIVGNGKHWELGIGFSGGALLWECNGEQQWRFYADLNFTHLFKARQRRSFDLFSSCPTDPEKFLSRYMLVKIFDQSGNTGLITPLINFTTFDCTVRMDIQMDAAFMFEYTHCGFLFDVGYDGWIRSKEKIDVLNGIPRDFVALKGIQNVYSAGGVLLDTTESTATIYGNFLDDQALVVDPNSPIFIRPSDIDPQSAASPLVLTHKFFIHLGYAWYDKFDWSIPFIGVGGEIEIEGINPRGERVPFNNTLNQWGVWVKGGFTF